MRVVVGGQQQRVRVIMPSGDTARLYKGDLRRLTKTIRTVISFLGLLLLAVIAFTGWSANKTAAERESRLLENALNQSIANILDGQKSVAWWDDAVLKINDLDFVDDNFGIFLTETYGHDEVYILDGNDKPLFAHLDAKRADPNAFERRRPSIEAVVSEIRQHGAPALKTRPDAFGQWQTNYRLLAGAPNAARWGGHILSVGGRPAVVAGITILPNVDMEILKGTPNLLISVVYIDDDFIARISRAQLLPNLKLTSAPVTSSGSVSQPFIGDDGIEIGFLSWDARLPGNVLLTIILPLVACGVLATAFLSNHMFQRLRRASDELTQREATARHAAKHDALSGLPNREHLIEEVESRLATLAFCDEEWRAMAAYVDIDRFKDINDTLGHEAGDKLIMAVAKRLRARLRIDDFLARFGGDEFAVLCLTPEPNCDTLLAQRIASALEDPFAIAGQTIRVTASVGIALSPEHGHSADELMRHADIALYEAKNLGRDRAVAFSAEMALQLETRRSIELDLRAALEQEALELHYQPIVCCRTGAVVGVEALMRWTHPVRGNISPAVFIPIAEACGLMGALGGWMLDRAMEDSKQWPDLEIAVNLSPVQFTQTDLERVLRELSAKRDVAPERFVLEITEGVLLEANDHTKSVLKALQAMGFKTALDDFGTGYSSLAYLCDFKFDKIKIDRSFVTNVSNVTTSRTIVQSVVSLGRGLGMMVVAEGVETEYEALMMSHFGCTELQGYYFSRPVPAVQLGPLLETFEPRRLHRLADTKARDPSRTAIA